MKLKMTANQTQSRLIVPNQVILWLEMASIAPRQCAHPAIFAGYFGWQTAKRPQTVKPSQTQSNPCLSVLRFPRPAFQTVKPSQTQSNHFLTSTIHHRIIPSLHSARSRPQAPFPMKAALPNPQSAILNGKDEPRMDTDGHGWEGFLVIRVHPRSSAVQIRNPQSAIRNSQFPSAALRDALA
jgi:hypothetical protein